MMFSFPRPKFNDIDIAVDYHGDGSPFPVMSGAQWVITSRYAKHLNNKLTPQVVAKKQLEQQLQTCMSIRTSSTAWCGVSSLLRMLTSWWLNQPI